MKKRFLTLAAACLMTVGAGSALTSCGDDPASSSTSSSTEHAEDAGTGKNEISMWAPNGEFAHVKSIISKYNELIAQKVTDKDLTVKVRIIDKSEHDVGNVFNTNPEGSPVIMHVPGNNALDWASNEKLVSLGDSAGLTSKATGTSLNVPESAYTVHNGATYGLAFTVNTFFLIYNKEVYKTEDDVKTIGTMQEALKKYNDTAETKIPWGIGMDCGNGWQMQSFISRQNVLIQGVNGTNADYNGFIHDKDKVVENFLDYNYLIQHAVDKGAGVAKGPFMFASADPSVLNKASNTRCAAYISGTWHIDGAIQALGKENVGCAILPQTYNVQTGKYIDWPMIQDYKSVVLNQTAYNKLSDTAKEATLELYKFMFTSEGQKLRYGNGTITPAVVADPLEGIDPYIADKALQGAMGKNTFIQPSTTKFNNYWDAATAFYSNYVEVAITKEGVATPGKNNTLGVYDDAVEDLAAYRTKIGEGVDAIAAKLDAE